MTAHPGAGLAVACVCAFCWPPYGEAHGSGVSPPSGLMARVGIEQRLGAALPMGLVFRNAQGAPVRLGDVLGGKPAVVAAGYYACRNLCDVVRAGIAHSVRASGLTAGREFNVVLFSIDPRESAAVAAAAQGSDAKAHPRAQIARWQYLTGESPASAALASALGFRYLFDPRTGQYAHAAGVVVVSPQGAITQYLLGATFSPLTLRLALVNASSGRIGTLADRVLLLCCDYDSSTGRYSLLIGRILQVLGILTVLTLALLILVLRRLEMRRRSRGVRA